MNFSLSSARKCAVILLAAVLSGCGPKDGSKELRQGKEAYALHDLAKAERLLMLSLERGPTDVDRLLSLARVKLELGDLSSAKDLITKAVLNADGEADVRMLNAQIAWHAKDYKTAADEFGALANDANLSPEIRAQAWAGLGVVEMTRDSHHLARVAFLRAIRLDRRNAAAWYHLGLVYQEFGYLEAALEQFEIFVRLEVGASPRVQKVQKSVIPALKESIARAALERPGAAKRNSAACSTALARAESEIKKGLVKSARQSYIKALDADPLSYPAALGLAKVWERIDPSKEGLAKAFEYYKQACSLRASAVSTFLTTGALASRLNYNSQAIEIYSRAVAASPTSFDALDGLIRALQKIGGNRVRDAKAYQLYRDSIPAKKR